MQRSEAVLDLLDDLLTVEFLVSAAVLRRVDAGTALGAGVAGTLAAVAAVVDDLGVAPTSDEIHAARKSHLYDRVLPAAATAAAATA